MSPRDAYEADCAARPFYHDGQLRRTWDQLTEVARASWIKNPTPRDWLPYKTATELTSAGEQHVIPGCERNASPKATQLDLFG